MAHMDCASYEPDWAVPGAGAGRDEALADAAGAAWCVRRVSSMWWLDFANSEA